VLSLHPWCAIEFWQHQIFFCKAQPFCQSANPASQSKGAEVDGLIGEI